MHIPRFLLATLLLYCTAATAASANELYRWRDADGTLTFSQTPPPDGSGIEYERVASKQGITLSQPTLAQSTLAQPTLAAATHSPGAVGIGPSALSQHLTPTASRRKSVQCGELQKRVLSLERLLRTEISAQTMDNAIVQMSRYQNSFNRACNK